MNTYNTQSKQNIQSPGTENGFYRFARVWEKIFAINNNNNNDNNNNNNNNNNILSSLKNKYLSVEKH